MQRSDENKTVMYMTWDQEIMESEAKGIAKGRLEGDKNRMVRDVHNLMDSLNLMADQAMQALKLSSEEQSELLPLL